MLALEPWVMVDTTELVKIFTSVESSHVKEVVTSSREGGASLNILSGLVAGNFSAYWLGMAMMGLMAVAYGISTQGMDHLMIAPAVFSFGLVAFPNPHPPCRAPSPAMREREGTRDSGEGEGRSSERI